MGLVTAKCPYCGKKNNHRKSSDGTLLKCKHCGQKYELKVRYGCGASGCLVVVVLFVVVIVFASVMSDNKVAQQQPRQPAPVSEEPTPANPQSEQSDTDPAVEAEEPLATVRVKPPTSYAKLRQFSNETDELLKEIDKAISSGLIRDDAAWGEFAREFNRKSELLRIRSGTIEPMQARLAVGSVAGYVQQLLVNRDDKKYRDYVSSVIQERDDYLESIRPKSSAMQDAIAKASSNEKESTEEFHTWTSGEYSVEAKFLSFTNDHIKIEKRDGSTADVPIDRLSDESKEQLREILRTKTKRQFDF